jgi:lipoprotein-anchoring transpeptidase ErfK/SrfK
MAELSRRSLIVASLATGTTWSLAGCGGIPTQTASVAAAYQREDVQYATREPPGTIVVDPQEHHLYLVQQQGRALRYEVGVGAAGFGWSGVATVRNKQEWPDWYPTDEFLVRRPEVKPAMSELQSGVGMVAGPNNPLGARALYLWQGNKDTLYRIHGTNEPWTIGKNVSSGCIRMTNEDIVDLYDRTPIGTKVVVLPSSQS